MMRMAGKAPKAKHQMKKGKGNVCDSALAMGSEDLRFRLGILGGGGLACLRRANLKQI